MRNQTAVLFAVLCVAACSRPSVDNIGEIQEAEFIGSSQCKSCHEMEFEQWRGSHHELAMQVVSDDTVLGDFSGTTFSYFGIETTFSKSDGAFVVKTENAQGAQEEFQVTHTFGVAPLQQYLVDVPGGRKQALQVAWDARPADKGGQRWYHLYSDEYIGPGDPLHWTERYFNWNYMCAECHSTNLTIGYDIETDSFDTMYSETSVGCEACHGPGSTHVEQANSSIFDESRGLPVDLDDRAGAVWVIDAETGIAERTVRNHAQQQPESCGRCHSRRSVVAPFYEYGVPLADTHMPSLLEENLYHSDGRIQDEVYVYGSFVQSKMYAAGVTCSDCHNPHSGQLHAGSDPNDTCASCHLPAVFAGNEHVEDNSGDCVSCHMPATTYMGVDDRRDHSFRLPDTNDDQVHYGSIIAIGREGAANDELLRGITDTAYPPIARATMLMLLESIDDAAGQATSLEQLDNPDSFVRIGALRALRQQAPEFRMRYGSHLLRDPVRSVRVEAALTYLEYRDLLPLEDGRAFPDAAADYRNAMTSAAAMPDAALNLAEFETRLGNTAAAARMYKHAIRIGPDSPSVQYAYGLYLVRSGSSSEALEHLRQATELAPEVARYVYVYGVALNSLGQSENAIEILSSAHDRFPEDFDIAWALATMYRDHGEQETARSLLDELVVQFPNRSEFSALGDSLN